MIDREKVIRAVDEAVNMYESEYGGTSYFDEKEWAENKRDALFLLKEQEAVVRCKDCIYLNVDTGICIVGIPHGHKDTFYCSYGRRR